MVLLVASGQLLVELFIELTPGQEPLLEGLQRELHRRSGILVPLNAFDLNKLPAHLRLTFAVEGPDGTELARDRTDQSFCVPKGDIVGNDYDLSINRYKEVVHAVSEHLPPKEILAKLAVLAIVLAISETLVAKMRLFRVQEYLSFAYLLGLLGMLSHIILEASR